MWQQGYPEDPRLEAYEEKMEIITLLDKIKDLPKPRKRRKKKKSGK
jgi:hypothetical protein